MDTHACTCCPLLLNLLKDLDETLTQKILNDWMVRSKRASCSSSLWNPPILAFYLGLFPSVSNNYTPTPSPTALPRSKLEVFFSAFFSGASGTNCGARVWLTLRTLLRSPPVGLAWQWKPRATEGDPQRKASFEHWSHLPVLLRVFSSWREPKQRLRKGGLQGRQKKIIHGKSNCNMKRSKEGAEPDGWRMGSPDPPPELHRGPPHPLWRRFCRLLSAVNVIVRIC